MRLTYHLVPAAVWLASDETTPYAAASLVDEGFIHTTDGEAELIATANRHYAEDLQPLLALTVDLDATGSPWRIEDERGIYPHIFGPIERAAILDRRPMIRDRGGRFTGFGDSLASSSGTYASSRGEATNGDGS
jgi:uncharacterized protein (DUF952 family)